MPKVCGEKVIKFYKYFGVVRISLTLTAQ